MTTLQGWNLKCDPKMTHTLHLTITQNGHISMHFDLLKSDRSTKRRPQGHCQTMQSVCYHLT